MPIKKSLGNVLGEDGFSKLHLIADNLINRSAALFAAITIGLMSEQIIDRVLMQKPTVIQIGIQGSLMCRATDYLDRFDRWMKLITQRLINEEGLSSTEVKYEYISVKDSTHVGVAGIVIADQNKAL